VPACTDGDPGGYTVIEAMRDSRLALPLVLALVLCGCLGGGERREQPEPPPAPVPTVAPEPVVQEPVEETPELSLPAPAEKVTPLGRPTEEPTPPEIGYTEAWRQITRLYPRQVMPFIAGGRLALLLYDLNSDGHAECLALGVSAEQASSAGGPALDDPQRLFQGEPSPVGFYLLVFANNKGNFRRLQSLPLGEHIVFESFTRTPLFATRAMPVIVTVAFQTLEGRESELLVFDSASGIPRFRRSLVSSLNVQSRLQDIDEDGAQDLVVQEKAVEEGTGYETFLTWYRWNGSSFSEHRSLALVRSLNGFLQAVRELLLEGNLRELASLAVDPEERSRLRGQGLRDGAILLRCLGLQKIGLTELPAVQELIFPPILESPFTEQDSRGSFFRMTYRLVDSSGASYISTTLLYLAPNPFGARQFLLEPPP
jgi:hypothetical protein